MHKLRKIWSLLKPVEKTIICSITVVQLILTAVDLILLATLYYLISKLNSSGGYQNNAILEDLFSFMSLNSNEKSVVPYYVLAFITVIKVIMSYLVQKITLRVLGKVQQRISQEIVRELSESDFTKIKGLTSQELSYLATTSVDAAIVITLSSSINLIVDTILITCILVSILFSTNLQVIWVVVMICIVAYFLQGKLSKQANISGQKESISHLSSINLLDDIFSNLREIRLRGSLVTFLDRFSSERKLNSIAVQDRNLLQQFPKFIFEIFMIILLCGFSILSINLQFTASEVSSIFTLIIVISVRVLPALIRMQSSITTIHSWAGVSEKLFNSKYSPIAGVRGWQNSAMFFNNHIESWALSDIGASIEIKNVSFCFDEFSNNVISGVNLNVKNNEFIGVVGPSGSGKSTFADLIAGFLCPSSGEITIDQLPVQEYVSEFPGKMSYIPQEVKLIQGSVLENIALKVGSLSDSEVERIELLMETVGLSSARFKDFDNRYVKIGPSFSELSGGEKQRLGLARAMYTSPNLILMDEMTSSLDSNSQNLLTEVIDAMKGKVTLIVIAHRLETIKNADRILTIQNGELSEKL